MVDSANFLSNIMAYSCKELTGSVIHISEDNKAKIICASDTEITYEDMLFEAFKEITDKTINKTPKSDYIFFIPSYIRDKLKVGCTYKFTVMYNMDKPETSAITDAEQII